MNVAPPFQRFRRRRAFPENRPSTRWRISIVREMRSVFITRSGWHLMSQLCDLWLEPHRLDYASCRWLPRERSTSAVIVLVRACIRASVSFFGCLNNMTDCLRHIQDLNGNYAWLSACLWSSMLSARGSCLDDLRPYRALASLLSSFGRTKLIRSLLATGHSLDHSVSPKPSRATQYLALSNKAF